MTRRIRVFLANVGVRSFNNYWVVPPMGILMLAAYLREKMPVDLMLVNQRLDNCTPEALAQQAVAFNADVVGLSALTPNAHLLNPILRGVRAGLPDAFTLVGGGHPSALGPSVLETIEADAAVLGEGELLFEQAVRARFETGDLSQVAGLVWRASDGTIHTNPGHPGFIEDLDALPMPAYDLIDLPQYWSHQTIAPMSNRKYVSLLTSRGCPYGCIFCHKIFGKRMRVHSAERVVEEIAWFQRKYGVDDFELIDDTFNCDSARIIQICDLLRARGLRIRLAIPNGIRGDLLTETEVEALSSIGLYHCMIPLESGSPRIQSLIRKHLDIPRFLDACAMVAKRRIFIHTCCILGFPTETEAEMQQTIDIACEARSHTTSFFTAIPFPGTPLYDMVREQHPEKLARLSFDDATYTTVAANLTDLPDHVLHAYQRKAVRTYFMNPNRIYRLLRAHPQPLSLLSYFPLLCYRSLRGVVD